MSARGNFRGGYGGQYPVRGHYNQGPQSSGHATPNSSFHGTPPAQSPYGGSRGSWGGQQQFSPQNQFPPQYPQNGYAPTAPAAHYQGNQANSPPIGTPTGPSNQFSQSPYRGGYRSSSGGYRGNSVGAGRGGNRGGFKSGHWGSSGSGSRAASSQPDETGSGRGTPRAGSIAGDQVSVHSDSATQEADNPFRPPKELQVEDTTREENNETQPMPPPTTGIPETIETTGTNENETNAINAINENNEINENTEITESGLRPNMPQKVEIYPGMCRLSPEQLRWLGSRGNVRSSKSPEIPENLVFG
ncbi:serine/threonine protein kinase, CMGC, CDC2/CDK subfamily [Cytospora paraplurivora]|uniref:Serine/threonine protein kinase, CMGC, CDC2/CDK subfamily n=1 Tax=Cytospora paraplurivora TaxID=2898453 RepID=A0AAN9UXS4_9PEZI